MKNQLKQEVSITESPYYIWEDDRGKFYIVNSVTLNGNKNWTIILNKESKLEEGLDIKEFPSRDISILVEVPNADKNPFQDIIDKLRDFAYLGSYDYFSYMKPIVKIDSNNYKVKPRIFRKIVND